MDQADQSASRLLLLPLELRETIYFYTLAGRQQLRCWPDSIEPGSCDRGFSKLQLENPTHMPASLQVKPLTDLRRLCLTFDAQREGPFKVQMMIYWRREILGQAERQEQLALLGHTRARLRGKSFQAGAFPPVLIGRTIWYESDTSTEISWDREFARVTIVADDFEAGVENEFTAWQLATEGSITKSLEANLVTSVNDNMAAMSPDR